MLSRSKTDLTEQEYIIWEIVRQKGMDWNDLKILLTKLKEIDNGINRFIDDNKMHINKPNKYTK